VGYRQARCAGELVVGDAIEPRDQARLRLALDPDEFDRLDRIHPTRLV
jgi:hypothetical protein